MMASRVKRAFNDPSRFEGNGISYKAKLIGIEDVKDARGDIMCQEALIKLKNSVRISGEHKRKIFINVTLEGLKIIDAISLIVLHSHAVHRISFISRDTTDNRAFGYVYGTEDGLHKFFAIKTAAAAEHLVLTLRDLFQVVYEMKKREMEAAKEKLEKGEAVSENFGKENSQSSGEGSTAGNLQTPTPKVTAETENIYQVPPNNAPINQSEAQAEQVANLLELEDQADNILKGIEQIKNLELDSFASDSFSSSASSPTSSQGKPASSLNTTTDPWGLSATTSTAAASSALEELAGLQTGSFTTGAQQPFGGANFAAQSGFGGIPGFNSLGGGLPVTSDPFGTDPFSSAAAQQPRMPAAVGFGGVNPFAAGFNQPYGMAPRMGMMGAHGMMPGMVPHGMMPSPMMGGVRGPFGMQPQGFQTGNPFGDDSSVLQPLKKDGGPDPNAGSNEAVKARPKSPRDDLFGDLLEIKKSSPATARSPKEMFAQINAPERKPMKEMTGPGKPAQNAPAQASSDSSDPFGDTDLLELDKTRGFLLSDSGEEDPFDASHIPPSLADLPNHDNFTRSPVAIVSPPPVPLRHTSSNPTANISSSFSMPSSPPPPLPSTTLPSPPPPLPSTTLPSPPPPLPSTTLPSPPIPCRTPAKSETVKDINDKHTLHPSQLNATSDILSCHPLPNEPPPPLPRFLAFQSQSSPMPPSSPRPSSQSTPHFSQFHKDSNKLGLDSKQSSSDGKSSPNKEIHKSASSEQAILNVSSNQSQISSINGEANFCDITKQSDVQTGIKNSVESQNFLKSSSISENKNNFHQNSTSKSSNSSWVGFDNSDNFSESRSSLLLSSVSYGDENDPFSAPVLLTPGFKAEAKFGSDPFDDNASGLFSDEWDPFTEGDRDFNNQQILSSNQVNSPFGDAFSAPAQQVGEKSLFD